MVAVLSLLLAQTSSFMLKTIHQSSLKYSPKQTASMVVPLDTHMHTHTKAHISISLKGAWVQVKEFF